MPGQSLCAIHGHIKQVAEWRHGAHFALGEAVLKFLFVRKIDKIGIQDVGQSVPTDTPGSGHDQHGHFAIQFNNDGFHHPVAGDFDVMGELLGGKRRGVRQAHVFHACLIKVFLQLLYRHSDNLLPAMTAVLEPVIFLNRFR